jgi:hypothetical protein
VTPIEYEKVTKILYQSLLKEGGYKDVNVQHDVKVTGIESGCDHQIDVFWEIDIADTQQKFCIECKMLKGRVKKESVIAFSGKVADIGGAKGIFVSASGFQKGAIQFAKSKGIELVDIQYEFEKYEATLAISIPRMLNLNVSPAYCPPDICNKFLAKFQDSSPEYIDIYNEEGKHLGSLGDYLNSLDHDEDGFYKNEVEDVWVRVDHENIVAILEIAYDYEINIIPSTEIKGHNILARAVMNKVLENTQRIVNMDAIEVDGEIAR